MDKWNKKGLLVDCLVVLGWALVSAGAAMLNIAAGLMVSGALAIAAGVVIGRGPAE